jgi:hypothetical protein
LFALVGGSLIVLFRDVQLGPDGQRNVIQAAGCISLGLILGLLGGFLLRHYDQTYWMPETVRKWAELDRELRVHGQQLHTFQPKGAAGDVSAGITKGPPDEVKPSVALMSSMNVPLRKLIEGELDTLRVQKGMTDAQKEAIDKVLRTLARIETMTAAEARQELSERMKEFGAAFPQGKDPIKDDLQRLHKSIQ